MQSWKIPKTLNLYQYVQNSPLSQMDNDGHETLKPQEWDNKPEHSMSNSEEKMIGLGLLAAGTAGVSAEMGTGAALMSWGRSVLTAATSFCLFHCSTLAEYLANTAPGSSTLNMTGTAESVEGRLSGYLFNAEKSGGKAQFFEQALGFNKSNMSGLATRMKCDPKAAIQGAVDQYVTRYSQDIQITGANGRVVIVQVCHAHGGVPGWLATG